MAAHQQRARLKTGQMSDDQRAELQRLDQLHHFHPFTDPSSLAAQPPFLIERAEGVYIEGQGFKLLDAMAGLGCVNIGYGRKELAEIAAETLQRLSFYQSFAAVSNPEAAALAGKIASLVPQQNARVFFANSGSEANESIVKMARLYWAIKGQPEKRMIISRDYAYHGSTELTSALNGNARMHKQFGLTGHGEVAHAMAPYWYRLGAGDDPQAFANRAIADMAAKIDELGADKVAAVIAEPIMGTSGAITPPADYLPQLESVCRDRDVLLIADEVVTGFGRTGHWFAQQKYGYTADFTTLAKGLSSAYVPISAAVAAGHVVDVLTSEPGVFQHGFTTSAHPMTAAVALKNIELIEQEGLVTRIANDIGPYFSTALRSLETLPIVGEVRVSGLIAGIEFAKDKSTREQYPVEFMIDEHVGNGCLVRGLLVRPVGNAIVLCPPFIISRQDVDQIVAVLGDAIMDITQKLREQGY